MSQCYVIVNLDDREYLTPHRFGHGASLKEIDQGPGVMTALALLCSDGNGRGGNDFYANDRDLDQTAILAKIAGRWAGKRIVVARDYGDPGKFVPAYKDENLCDICWNARFTDISSLARQAICSDNQIRREMDKRADLIASMDTLKEKSVPKHAQGKI